MFDFYDILLIAMMSSTSAPPPPDNVALSEPVIECRSYDAARARRALLEAQLHLSQGEYDQAADWLEGYLTDCPHDARAQHQLGRVYERLGRVKDAARRYRVALLSAPEFFRARMDLVQAYITQGESEKAKAQMVALEANCDGDCQDALDVLRVEIAASVDS